MKPHAALLVVLTLALPLAAADQDVEQGPVALSTVNTESGDACGGTNGYHQRTLEATVEIAEGETVGAYFYQTCADQDWGNGGYHSNGFFASVDHRVDNNAGPQVYVAQSDTTFYSDYGDMHMCGTWVSIAGVALQLGCMPLGTQVPLAPALP